VRSGGKTWYFITVDFAFGMALEMDATEVITANGGRVLGAVRYPLGNADYSSMLLQAQASDAEVIGLASVGNDLVNLVKQAGEFGVSARQTLAGFLIYITEVHALGLQVAQGFTFASGFYWDQNDASRAWAKRFFERQKAMPTRVQAAVYTASLHFMKSVQKAGTREAVAVNRVMRDSPVDYLGRPASIRADGRVIYDLTVYRVKRPGESQAQWNYYNGIAVIPAHEAFLAMSPGCEG
jgi:branched-chain amino acid transport system substrate-binding protein